jgi:hypothetical protein
MGRPRKLDLNKRVVKGKDGKIIKNSTKETYDRVYKACQLYGKGGKSVEECCESVGWKSTTVFYRAIVAYANCKEVANSVGLGLKHDPEIRPAKLPMPKLPPDKTFDIFDIIGLKKAWTDEEKFNAVKLMLEKLAKGIPLAYACALAGITRSTLEEWCMETPLLIEKIRTGDAMLIEMMFNWLIVSGTTAAKQGKFGEILKGVEQRLPEKWGSIERLDIVTRTEKGKEDVLSLSAKQAETVGAEFEIEEV